MLFVDILIYSGWFFPRLTGFPLFSDHQKPKAQFVTPPWDIGMILHHFDLRLWDTFLVFQIFPYFFQFDVLSAIDRYNIPLYATVGSFWAILGGFIFFQSFLWIFQLLEGKN